VKRIPADQKMTIDDLHKISNETFEINSQLPNVKVIKRGVVSVDNHQGMFLHYTSTELDGSMTLYYTNYYLIHGSYIYLLTATCKIKDMSKMQPVFYRALESFKFPK